LSRGGRGQDGGDPAAINRSLPRDYDQELYAARHLIETSSPDQAVSCHRHPLQKTARNFLAAIQLVASVVWLN
jgi:hypothetical protein